MRVVQGSPHTSSTRGGTTHFGAACKRMGLCNLLGMKTMRKNAHKVVYCSTIIYTLFDYGFTFLSVFGVDC